MQLPVKVNFCLLIAIIQWNIQRREINWTRCIKENCDRGLKIYLSIVPMMSGSMDQEFHRNIDCKKQISYYETCFCFLKNV